MEESFGISIWLCRWIVITNQVEAVFKLERDLALIRLASHAVQELADARQVFPKHRRADDERVHDNRMFPDQLPLLVAPNALGGWHGRRSTIELGQQRKSFENPLPLIANLNIVLVLIRNVNSETLPRIAVLGTKFPRQVQIVSRDPTSILLLGHLGVSCSLA